MCRTLSGKSKDKFRSPDTADYLAPARRDQEPQWEPIDVMKAAKEANFSKEVKTSWEVLTIFRKVQYSAW